MRRIEKKNLHIRENIIINQKQKKCWNYVINNFFVFIMENKRE